MRKVDYCSHITIDGIEYHHLTYDEFASMVIEDQEEAIELIDPNGNSLGDYTRHELEEEGLLV